VSIWSDEDDPQQRIDSLNKELEEALETLGTKRGLDELETLLMDVGVGVLRLEREVDFPFEKTDMWGPLPFSPEKVDPRLPYFMPPDLLFLLSFLPLYSSRYAPILHGLLRNSAEMGFVIGWETARRRWQPQPPPHAPLWSRIFTPKKALIEKSGLSTRSLMLDLAHARDRVVKKVSADPPWEVEPRLKLSIADYVSGFASDPAESRLTTTVFYSLMMGMVIGYWRAKRLWPPPAVTAEELAIAKQQFMKDFLKGARGMLERGQWPFPESPIR